MGDVAFGILDLTVLLYAFAPFGVLGGIALPSLRDRSLIFKNKTPATHLGDLRRITAIPVKTQKRWKIRIMLTTAAVTLILNWIS